MTQVESYSPRRARRAAQPGPDQPTTSPSRRSVQTDPDGGLRGRHATPLGQGFGWVIIWTVIAALVPGAGMVAAGWRRLGAFLLGLQILAGLALAALALSGGALKRGIDIAIDPTKLLVVAAVAAGGGLLWVLLLLLITAQLRRSADLTRPQKLFSGVLVLALIVGVGLPAYKIGSYAMIQRGVVDQVFAQHGTGTKPSTKAADPWADHPRMNMLLVGSDAGSDRIGVRPDTLILASIDTKSGNTVLFSIPRNLGHVHFPTGTPGAVAWPNGFWCPDASGLNQCLINAVWQWAMTNKTGYTGRDRGLKATEDAVQGVLGLPVDGYMMLNLKGFQQFINDIHGLRITVRERLPIGGNSEHPVATHGYIEPGKNKKLNGFEALWYARSRWSTSDYDRMNRQRCVIAAVVDQADPTTVALNFPKIAKTIKGNLSTSIGKSELQAWVDLSLRVQKGKLYSLAFTDKVIPDRDRPDFAVIHAQVQKALTKSAKAAAPPSASPSAPSTKKKDYDPTKAQDVKSVC